VKLLAYRVFDPSAAPLLAKEPVDVAPRIARRAYELYEQHGRREGHADQDWLQAEREIGNEQAWTGEGRVNVLASSMRVRRDPCSL
jgi:hypothetical protein